MGRRIAVVSLVVGIVSALGGVVAPATGAGAGRYIVVLEEGVAHPRSVAKSHASEHAAEVGFVYRHALKGYSATIPESRVDDLAQDDRVAFISEDRTVTVTAQSQPTGIDRIDADLSPTADIDGVDERVPVDVAVIDTGIDLDHPDLNVVGGKNCQKGKSYNDGNGHGTHVAGTIGAKDNATGVVGVAPGSRLWAVRVLDNSGSGSWSAVICGIDWVTSRASTIEVANMSLSGTGSDDGNCGFSNNDSMHRAICGSVGAGVTYSVAAGNSAQDASRQVPAAYNEVMTVSALADFDGSPGGLGSATCRTDVDDTFASFSNFGSDIDLIAPGVCINSAWKGGGYKTISGTSMASPHVAGAAALYEATHPGTTPDDVKAALQAAGNLGWSNSDDGDSIKEILLNAGSF
jgi:subtilisin family serine protease